MEYSVVKRAVLERVKAIDSMGIKFRDEFSVEMSFFGDLQDFLSYVLFTAGSSVFLFSTYSLKIALTKSGNF